MCTVLERTSRWHVLRTLFGRFGCSQLRTWKEKRCTTAVRAHFVLRSRSSRIAALITCCAKPAFGATLGWSTWYRRGFCHFVPILVVVMEASRLWCFLALAHALLVRFAPLGHTIGMPGSAVCATACLLPRSQLPSQANECEGVRPLSLSLSSH